jgi:hypothetical protein
MYIVLCKKLSVYIPDINTFPPQTPSILLTPIVAGNKTNMDI